MIQPELLNDAALKKLLRVYPENAFLFKQGDKGNTMFIIIEGTIELFQKTLAAVRTVDIIGPGDILGEKAILSNEPYKRGLSAQAKTEVALLEFDHRNLQVIQSKLPNFVMQMLRMVTQRLDKANELISVLQLPDPCERLAQFFLYYAKYGGLKVSQGIQFQLNVPQIVGNLVLPEEYVIKVIEMLVKNNVLLHKDKAKDIWILTDEGALMASIALVKERVAA